MLLLQCRRRLNCRACPSHLPRLQILALLLLAPSLLLLMVVLLPLPLLLLLPALCAGPLAAAAADDDDVGGQRQRGVEAWTQSPAQRGPLNPRHHPGPAVPKPRHPCCPSAKTLGPVPLLLLGFQTKRR